MTNHENETKCSRCGEGVEHRPEADGKADGGTWGKWFHIRTGLQRCRPLCTFEDCTADAVQQLGYHGFDGSGSRFIGTGWRCEAHKKQGAIEWT